MRKYLSVICALMFMTSLISCGDSQESSSESSSSVSESATEEPITEEPTTEPETTTEITIVTTTEITTTEVTTTLTTTTAAIKEDFEFTQLYSDFFEPYINSVNKLTPEKFKQNNNEKFSDYDTKITEGNEEDIWSFEISDSNGNKVYMSFYPDNDMYEYPLEEWNWTLYLLSYNSGDKEISISDRYHLNSTPTYSTNDSNREPISQEVKNVDELKEFMFAVQ